MPRLSCKSGRGISTLEDLDLLGLKFGAFLNADRSPSGILKDFPLDTVVPCRKDRQSLYYLGGKRTALDYIAALERESDAKRAGEGKRIGFRVDAFEIKSNP